MTLRESTRYKQTSAGWLNVIPNNWDMLSSKRLFSERKERARPDDRQMTASQKHGVIYQDDFMRIENQKVVQVITGSDILKHVEPSDFIISMRSFQGGLEYSRGRGCISSAYVMLKPSDGVVPGYFRYLFKSSIYIQALQSTSNLVRDGQAMRYANFAQLPLPVPPKVEQQSIANFLDQETIRIDQLIEKKRLFVTGVARRLEALVDQAISDANVPRIRFEHLTQRVSRPVTLSEHNELVRLGLYNRGRGIFKKPAADEEGMGDSEFFFVEAGDLILSGQFAWEGAVALATAEEEGCVVSHRYPVYRGKSGVNTSYLLGLLRSTYGDFLLNEASRGSAGRNRPLNVRRLGREKIPVPGWELQQAVEQAVDFERRLKGKTKQSVARLEEFRAALITAAVTGQIDVETWGRQGHSDRRLEKIGEAST